MKVVYDSDCSEDEDFNYVPRITRVNEGPNNKNKMSFNDLAPYTKKKKT